MQIRDRCSTEGTVAFTFALRRIALYLLSGLCARLSQQK